MSDIITGIMIKNMAREMVKRATARNSNGELKQKVKDLLIKYGNNPNEVDKMIEKEFEYAARTYSTPAKIAEAIRILY